jgi:aldose 1-epimerase
VPHSVVLGYEDPAAYRTDRTYMGAVVGRFANRIAGGRFTLDGQPHDLDRNEGTTTLHGGTDGFHRHVWSVAQCGADFVTLTLTSRDGDQGFPGTLTAICRYRVVPPATVEIVFEATTDAPTVVSLAQHAYWNLDGSHDIDRHHLQVQATRAVASDQAGLPVGMAPAPPLGALRGRVLDTNFCLGARRRREPEPAAVLTAGDLSLEVRTTEPGLQVYTGQHLVAPFRPRQGLCLEAQAWPDAPNQPLFPSARLDPGMTYRQRTLWTLRARKDRP